MNLIRKIWNNFKSQPDIWFFYGFLATFTLSIRKVLFFYPINGQFNEYTGIYLYLSDIFLFLTIVSWLISILCNKYSILSIIKSAYSPRLFHKMFHVEHFHLNSIILILLIFILWSFISIAWSTNTDVALFRSFKLLEFYFLFLYISTQIVPRASRRMFHVEQLDHTIKQKCSTPACPVGRWNNFTEIKHSNWDGTILKNLFKIIIATGLIQSTLGIWQFIIQHSIGLSWLKESLISPETAGVAKVIFDGDRIIRSYGLFPHPNILGGFLLLSIMMTIAYYKMFHVEHYDKTISNIKCSTWNNNHCEVYIPTKAKPRSTELFHVEQFSWIWLYLRKIQKIDKRLVYSTILTIQILATFLTFSKSAILGLIITIFYIHMHKIVPRGTIVFKKIQKLFHVEQYSKYISDIKCSTWNNNHCEVYVKNYNKLNIPTKMFHVEHFGRKLFIVFGIIIMLVVITKPDINSLFFKSLDERMLYINVSRGTISNNPIFGVGSGQFVANISTYTNQPLSEWQFQPVHNVFLLIWSELGLIGFSLFILFLWKMFYARPVRYSTWNILTGMEQYNKSTSDIKCSTWNNGHCEIYGKEQNVPRGTLSSILNIQKVFKGILLGFIFIMFFDHYLWDIQQGQIMFWLVIAILAGLSSESIDK